MKFQAGYLNQVTTPLVILLFIPLMLLPACSKDNPDQITNETVLNQRLRSKVQTLDPGDSGDSASNAVCREF